MTDIGTLGTWEAENVTVGQVEAALSELRRHEQRAAVRTSVLTLVVVVDSHQEAEVARQTVRDLGDRHPSRTLLVVLEDEDGASEEGNIDACATVLVVEREGRAVCFEEVVLEVSGRARHHLDSVVEPFTLPEVPLVLWLPARLPAPGDPLVAAANRIVVDSRTVSESAGVLSRIATLSRRLPLTDLSWMRLAPWRSLLAGLFEGSVHRPFLDGVKTIEVAGNYGPRHLFAGWLLRRLHLRREQVSVAPADHVSIAITAVADGRQGTFRVVRPGNERVIEACVDIEGGPTVRQTLQMRERWPSLALADALTHLGRDEQYAEALAGAVELSR